MILDSTPDGARILFHRGLLTVTEVQAIDPTFVYCRPCDAEHGTDAEHRCAGCGSPLNVRLLEAPGEESLYICSECDREFARGLSGEFCQDC
jgi:hypothetical protein